MKDNKNLATLGPLKQSRENGSMYARGIVYPGFQTVIDESLSKKIYNYIRKLSDECITVEDVLYAFNQSKSYLDISNSNGIVVSVLFPRGMEAYKIDFKEKWNDKRFTEEFLISYLKTILIRIESRDPVFKQKVELGELNLKEGWESIYNLLFEGFTYRINLPIKTDENKEPENVFISCDITSDDTIVSLPPRFKDMPLYLDERMIDVNNVFKDAIDYIRNNNLFIENIKNSKSY